MIQIPLTQGQFAKVDILDYEWLSKHKWFAKKSRPDGPYRAARSKRVNGQVVTVYMAREITNCPIGMEVDHRNRDELDNRRENLKVCTRQENLQNRCYERS